MRLEPVAKLRAVISGSGLDGLCLASVLARGRWDVLILLDWPHPSTGGYLVELGGEGLATAQEMGLLSKLQDRAECLSHVRWVDARGKPIADVQVGGASIGSEEPLYVARETFERMLLEQLPESVEIRSGVAVDAVSTTSGALELQLTSGESLVADLLVGADGGKSRIRKLAFGNDGLWYRPLGYHAAAFIFQDTDVHRQLAGHLTVLSAPGRLVTLCPLQDGRVAVTFAFRAASEMRPKNPAERLRFVFGDLKWCVPTVLEHARRAGQLHYDRATQIKTCTWYRARVGLLGDACHAYSLLPGQGCSAVLAAAHSLGMLLVRGASFDSAFCAYEELLARDLLSRRGAARRVAGWLMPESRTELALRNGLLKIAALPGLQRLIRPSVSLAT